ncbi:MAG: UDP-N-acetylmuramoyl-tripeptide--D-alanyl-D-alanine ligase [Deltaproteobacteria bacterium]|nr:MAG: UDP-N-acetylmuramoyl-tripeptide--D-alanyl-D-alanine ligase [Deltaproteobacteria bacterium]
MIRTKDIVRAISGKLVKGDKDITFSGIKTDSRKIEKGDLFWALKGERFDGHDFISSAINAGAYGAVIKGSYTNKILGSLKDAQDVVIISAQDTLRALGDLAGWWRNQHNVKVIGITGSTGKTSTKEMISHILSIGKKVLKNPGNYNNLIGLPITLLSLDSSHDISVLEMGMNMPGEIRRLTEIADPDIGLITNIGPAHLQGVKDIHGVARAKTELVEKISSNATVFINGDNELLVKSASKYKKQIIRFGKNAKNDIKLERIVSYGIKGSIFRLSWEGRSLELRINVPGISSIMNALAASAICLYLGEPEENIRKGLLMYQGVKGRFEIIVLENDNILINDTYNSNPLSLKASMESIKDIKGKRGLIIGLGDMLELGDYSVHAHREAGRMAAGLNPELFIAMGSFSEEMIEGAREAGMSEHRLLISHDHEEMVYEIEKRLLKKGCIIFLKGSRAMALERVAEGIMNRLCVYEMENRGL